MTDSIRVEASRVAVENVEWRRVFGDHAQAGRDRAVLNGRHYSRLAMLLPGAVYQSSSDELSGVGLNAVGSPVSINGLSATSSGWFLDGAYDVNVGNGSANTHVPVIDSIEEVQVQTSN